MYGCCKVRSVFASDPEVSEGTDKSGTGKKDTRRCLILLGAISGYTRACRNVLLEALKPSASRHADSHVRRRRFAMTWGELLSNLFRRGICF